MSIFSVSFSGTAVPNVYYKQRPALAQIQTAIIWNNSPISYYVSDSQGGPRYGLVPPYTAITVQLPFVDSFALVGNGTSPTTISTLTIQLSDEATASPFVGSLGPNGPVGGYLAVGQTAYNTGVGWWVEAGPPPRMSLGDPASNFLTWDGTTLTVAGTVSLLSGTIAGVLTIGASGGIYQGSGTFASPTTGLKVWNDGGVGRIAGYNAGVAQWYADTDGRLYAGGGNAVLDSGGFRVKVSTAYEQARSYSFLTDATVTGDLEAQYQAGFNNLTMLRTQAVAGAGSSLYLRSEAPAGLDSQVALLAYGGSDIPHSALTLLYNTTGPVSSLTASVSTMTITGSLAVGTTPALSGAFRLPNNQWITARNAANNADVNLIQLSASNLLALFNSTVVIDGSGNTYVSGILALGASYAGVGQIRLPNNAQIVARNAANNADINLITVDTNNLVAIGLANTTNYPVSGSAFAVGWNRTNGSAEVNFWNTYNSPSYAFEWNCKLTASTFKSLMSLKADGTLFTVGGIRCGGDIAGTAGYFGLSNATAAPSGSSVNLTTLGTGGPASKAVNTWIKAYNGTTAGYIPFFT